MPKLSLRRASIATIMSAVILAMTVDVCIYRDGIEFSSHISRGILKIHIIIK